MHNLVISQHAQKRMQQRCIPNIVVDLLMHFGTETHSNGAVRITFDRKSKKKARKYAAPIKIPEEMMNIYAVVADHTLVTIAHRIQK